MPENKLLQALYTVFLGALIALFVGFGISTFYEGPAEPAYREDVASTEAIADEQVQKDLDKQLQQSRDYEIYNEKQQEYSRNVSIIALVVAVLFIVIGMTYESKIKLLASGIMLGGIFTLLYSIGRGFATDDSRYVFMVLAVSLAIIFYLGHRRFVRPEVVSKKSTKKTTKKKRR